MKNNILVLGGTGKTGRRVAERLVNLHLPVRIGSRGATPSFDWEKSDNWNEVMKDIQKVYITFQPDLAVPGSVEKIKSLIEVAKASGVQKLVLLSGRGEKEAQACENEVINSGMDWTVIRANWFMQNFSENFMLDSILAGHLILPKVNALEPFVDVDDIADVVVAAITDDVHSEEIYELTGPELLSFEQAVALISSAVHRPIAFTSVSMEEYTSILRSYQLPEDYIWLIQYLFTEVLDGRNESLTKDVEKVLGRKPTTFQQYVTKTNKSEVWKTQQ
ncbi:MAG TPA: NAD(P)H-binding protein [Cytophagales bacterium]|nr:NAD(P)H-binding protein [Cytophagales bacterium]